MENVQIYAELEQRVATRTQQLENLNKELEAFSFSVSHDLKAPLRAVDGFAELLQSELGADASERSKEYLGQIRGGAARMRGLIEDLLRLANVARQPLRWGAVNLAQIARDALARLRAESPTRAVEVVVPENLPADVDQGLMTAVLENLLSNAWKYSGKKAQARIEFGVANDPVNGPVYFVRDNGAGFDPKRAEELFTPFQRLHTAAEFPGTGIGLATVQRIVHRHGGRIWAEAKVGQGATFSFTLPVEGR
jgi:hypothetical protein